MHLIRERNLQINIENEMKAHQIESNDLANGHSVLLHNLLSK